MSTNFVHDKKWYVRSHGVVCRYLTEIKLTLNDLYKTLQIAKEICSHGNVLSKEFTLTDNKVGNLLPSQPTVIVFYMKFSSFVSRLKPRKVDESFGKYLPILCLTNHTI